MDIPVTEVDSFGKFQEILLSSKVELGCLQTPPKELGSGTLSVCLHTEDIIVLTVCKVLNLGIRSATPLNVKTAIKGYILK